MGKKYVKMNLKFDETKRAEFLTGFSKRKEERKKKARRDLDKQVKEERARIRKNKREGIQSRLEEIHNIKMSNQPVGTICEDVNTTTLDLPNHDVAVVEADLFDPVNSLFMGDNVSEGEEEEKKEEETTKKTFNAKKHAESLSRLSKTQQRLNAKKQKSSSGKKSKQTKKYLKKKQSNPGKKKH